MAVYKLFPSQDTTIYSAYQSMNTGLDPILEIKNEVTESGASPRVSRALIKFDNNEIKDVINNKAKTLAVSASLKGFIAKATGVIMDSNIESFPLVNPFNNGTGRYLDNKIVDNGASWIWYDYSGSNKWKTDGFNSLRTASFVGSNNAGGGYWWTGSGGYEWAGTKIGPLEATQSFTLRSQKDLDLDVTDTVKVWYSSSSGLNAGLPSIDNNGFVVKWSNTEEFNTSFAVNPWLKYYSVDTNTIYPPELEIKWRDFVYEPDTLSIINTPDLFVALDNNQGTFYSQSINNFRLNVRPEFPARTYQTASLYTTNQALPSESFYAIKDLSTNEYVVDFDPLFTQISCDKTGSFFKVYMNGLQPERNYQILVKTNIQGNTIVLDENYTFKVVNG
tara:strand:+ start:1785 stop:2954 length:1170 start_codon:yes stop_codon:yes gene_type:complete